MTRMRYSCRFRDGTTLEATGAEDGRTYGMWINDPSDVIINGTKIINQHVEDIFLSDFNLLFFTRSKVDDDNDTQND